jgi:hypothetical protein
MLCVGCYNIQVRTDDDNKKTPLVFKANLTTSSTTTRQRRQGTHGEGGVRVKKPSTQPRAFFNNLIFQGRLVEDAPLGRASPPGAAKSAEISPLHPSGRVRVVFLFCLRAAARFAACCLRFDEIPSRFPLESPAAVQESEFTILHSVNLHPSRFLCSIT